MVELLLLGHHGRAGLRSGDAYVNLCVMLAANLWRGRGGRKQGGRGGGGWATEARKKTAPQGGTDKQQNTEISRFTVRASRNLLLISGRIDSVNAQEARPAGRDG